MSIVTWKCCDGSFCNEWLSCKPCRLLSSVQGFLREQIWTTLDWLTLFWIYNQIPARKALEYVLMSLLRQSVLVWPQKATGSPCFPGVMWWSVRFSWEAFQIRCYHSSNFYCRQSWKHEEKKTNKKKKTWFSLLFFRRNWTLLIVACRCTYKLLIQIAYELVFGCFQIFATGWQGSQETNTFKDPRVSILMSRGRRNSQVIFYWANLSGNVCMAHG